MLTEGGTPSDTSTLPKCRLETHATSGLTKNGDPFIAAACDAKCVTNSKMKKRSSTGTTRPEIRRTIRTSLRNLGANYYNSTASGPYARSVNGTGSAAGNGTRYY